MLFFGKGKFEPQRDSSEILFKKFFKIFGNLSLDDSYKLNPYKEKSV